MVFCNYSLIGLRQLTFSKINWILSYNTKNQSVSEQMCNQKSFPLNRWIKTQVPTTVQLDVILLLMTFQPNDNLLTLLPPLLTSQMQIQTLEISKYRSNVLLPCLHQHVWADAKVRRLIKRNRVIRGKLQ